MYYNLIFSLVSSISLLKSIFILISAEAYCEFFKVSISSISSKIVQAYAFCRSLKILSSLSFIFFVYSPIFTIISSFCASISSFSCFTTVASSCYLRPSKVTVKFIMLTLINIQGRNLGFAIFVNINNLNLLSQ